MWNSKPKKTTCNCRRKSRGNPKVGAGCCYDNLGLRDIVVERIDSKRKAKAWYGLTVEQYQAMVDKQEGKCAICGIAPPYQLAVDHCHETNTIRGLLCRPCNLGIGSFKHDPRVTEAAVEYREWEGRVRNIPVTPSDQAVLLSESSGTSE